MFKMKPSSTVGLKISDNKIKQILQLCSAFRDRLTDEMTH